MRTKFDQQLEELNVELIKMGALCERAIRKAVDQLEDTQVAEKELVDGIEEEINQKEREIEALCMKLLLQQQPVAGDLRQISSALKMISDMERIGDQAQDIADMSRFVQVKELAHKIHIGEMAEAAIKMVTESIDSFAVKVCPPQSKVAVTASYTKGSAAAHSSLQQTSRRILRSPTGGPGTFAFSSSSVGRIA